jgi:hypothetical protein
MALPFSVEANRPTHSSSRVVTANRSDLDQLPREALLHVTGLGQRDPWKQLCPLILQAASKDPIYGMEQLSRNSNERL